MDVRHLSALLRRLLLVAGLILAFGASASAASTLTLAPLTATNSTPDCPVSATKPICGPWNVPVDLNSIFGAVNYGQCTYWAAVKYPSLILDELLTDPLGNDWLAGTFAQHAASEGVPVTTTPEPGDLAVWASTSSDPDGHVAYVEAVVGSAVIVSQMDGNSTAPFPALQGTTQYIDATTLAFFRSSYNLQFIDTGDHVTGTPLSYVEAPASTASATPGATAVAVSSVAPTTTTATPAKKAAPKQKAKKKTKKKATKKVRKKPAKKARATRAAHR